MGMKLLCELVANVLFVIFTLLLVITTYAPEVQSNENGLSLQELIGKRIYHTGRTGEKPDISVRLKNNKTVMPATNFACANCHGVAGEGGAEGGIRASPIAWQILSRSTAQIGAVRSHDAYNEISFKRVITQGINGSGLPLHPSMPLYQMSDAQTNALIAYLKILGTPQDIDPGVSDTTIKIGTVLPNGGPLSGVGADIEAILRAYFKQINNGRGIYGRNIELIVESTSGKSDEVQVATQRLIELHKVFAMVASFEPGVTELQHNLFEQGAIPLIGPVSLTPYIVTTPNRYIFYLLPSFYDQARSLVDYISSLRINPERRFRLAVIHAKGDYEEAAAVGTLAQARLHGMDITINESYATGQFPAQKMHRLITTDEPDYIIFFGPGTDLEALSEYMTKNELNIPLATSTAMVGRAAFNLPLRVAKQLLLVHSAALPGQDDFGELDILLGVPGNNPSFQALALGAAKIFVEIAKRGGRLLNREIFINTIEQLHDFKTGVVPPVSFAFNRRIGVRSSYIVHIDIEKKRYIALTERIEPQ